MTTDLFFTVAVQFLLLLLAVSFHGATQAWVAALCGDPTASQAGRASLNPVRHFDVLGTFLFPALLLAFGFVLTASGFPIFGWGRPIPVVETNLRRPGWDAILVAGAGPAAHLLLTGAACLALVVGVHLLGPEARQAASLSLLYQPGAETLRSYPVMFTLVRMASLNAFMAAFHLIPLPPLAGGQIALRLLPPDWAARLAAIRPYGFMIGVLAALALVPLLLVPFLLILGMVINIS
jgi:Zn-dependent protease